MNQKLKDDHQVLVYQIIIGNQQLSQQSSMIATVMIMRMIQGWWMCWQMFKFFSRIWIPSIWRMEQRIRNILCPIGLILSQGGAKANHSKFGKASKQFLKVIFITLGTDLESDKNIFYFFGYKTIFWTLFEKNVSLPLEKLKTLSKIFKIC